uniref:ABC transmembrane type-2 domain-containing protein n=1 Tax=Haraldiophyllum bonnemaisonii TaxID=167977 RepID=A0A4D6WWM6_9FLOR|nr:hypothetical protein [Haraldiophyllum bonnemaisonii]
MKKHKYKINFLIKPKDKLIIKFKIYDLYIELKALITRLYIQIYRKPYIFLSGIIQPLLWMILFGSLFQNAPINLLETYDIKYGEFLSPGIIIFTTFTGSINSGLTIIFDREFGFLNKLLISPIKYKITFLLSLIFYIWILTNLQIFTIITFSIHLFNHIINITIIKTILYITTLIIINIASISIYIAFILPGHIEFLAFIFLINLPTLFCSTALAPLSFMPYWLQIIVSINPLTYCIEIIRNISINNNLNIIKTLLFTLNINQTICLLILINFISLIIINNIVKYKFD